MQAFRTGGRGVLFQSLTVQDSWSFWLFTGRRLPTWTIKAGPAAHQWWWNRPSMDNLVNRLPQQRTSRPRRTVPSSRRLQPTSNLVGTSDIADGIHKALFFIGNLFVGHLHRQVSGWLAFCHSPFLVLHQHKTVLCPVPPSFQKWYPPSIWRYWDTFTNTF